MSSDEALLQKVQTILDPYGAQATGLGPNSVGVQGDARVYETSIYVSFPVELSIEQIAEASTKVIDHVKGISRVLMNIPLT